MTDYHTPARLAAQCFPYPITEAVCTAVRRAPKPSPVPAPRRPSDDHDLPPTIDLMAAARALGIGRTKAYELARTGQFPCSLIRIGDLYRVPTAALRRLLDPTPPQPDGQGSHRLAARPASRRHHPGQR